MTSMILTVGLEVDNLSRGPNEHPHFSIANWLSSNCFFRRTMTDQIYRRN